MMGRRHLRLVHSSEARIPFSERSRHLRAVPDSQAEIVKIVEVYSDFLLEDHESEGRRMAGRRRFDVKEVESSVFCLSPLRARLLSAELQVIAEMSLNSDLRRAALLKLAEGEMTR
ncbi:MAG: hypothetical protein U0R44_02045 [Candidatus Micrarchaeia archaeon]